MGETYICFYDNLGGHDSGSGDFHIYLYSSDKDITLYVNSDGRFEFQIR